jgi:hypothetical protein
MRNKIIIGIMWFVLAGFFFLLYCDSIGRKEKADRVIMRSKERHQQVLRLLAETNDDVFPDPDVITFADRPEPDPEYMRKFAGEIP